MRELIRQAFTKAVHLNHELSEFHDTGMLTKRDELDTESIRIKCEGLIKTCNELIILCEVKR